MSIVGNWVLDSTAKASMGTDVSFASGCPSGIRATMGSFRSKDPVVVAFTFTDKTEICPGERKASAICYIPFIEAVGHITLRVILSWIFVSRFQLNAVAVATGIGWVLLNLFWSGCYLKKKL